MILVLDNYDSFVHNVARTLREVGGGPVRVVRSDALSVAAVRALEPSHVVISPGPCTPDEAGMSVEVVQSLCPSIPVLGICLGHQAVAQAWGGTVIRAPTPLHGSSSLIHHTGDILFQGIPDPFPAGRYHSLVVDPGTLPRELVVTARDREGTIMAIRHRDRPVWGVQFHPESILTPQGHRIVANFLQSSRVHA